LGRESVRTLVTGGTGFLGSHLVERLIAQGHEVRALARKTSDITHLRATGAQIIFGDVEDYDTTVREGRSWRSTYI